MMDLDPVEVRILGCLIEKQRTTPDTYPLSLNSLRLACNQTTNRDPVVEYDETTIREALHRLSQRRYTRLASGHTSRAYKFRHLLDEALGLDPEELAVLAVLLLRGAQTPGELKQRTERMQGFPDLAAAAGRARPADRARPRAAARAPARAEGGALPAPALRGGRGRAARRGGAGADRRRPPRPPRRGRTAASTRSRASWPSCATRSPRCASELQRAAGASWAPSQPRRAVRTCSKPFERVHSGRQA